MSKIFMFAGGCFSGKTTTINYVSNSLILSNRQNKVMNEEIRKYIDTSKESIDSIRKNPREYFSLEKKIIMAKMKSEDDAAADGSSMIYLFDRSIIDSLFYYQEYQNPAKIMNDDAFAYSEFEKKIISHYEKMMPFINKIFLFKPLNGILNTDKCRPANIEVQKNVEYSKILELFNR